MNRQYILDRIKPYLINNMLYEEDFNRLFSNLHLRQQYQIVNILLQENIDIIYDTPKPETEVKKEHKVAAKNYKNLNDLKNEQLCVLYKQGVNDALDTIVEKNTGLVRSRVLKYMKKYRNKLEFDDLYQFGMIGLIKATERFDIRKETNFTTYAVWWIDQAILRGIMEQSFLIRIPVHMFEKIFRLVNVLAINSYLSLDEIYENYFKNDMSKESFNDIVFIANNILDLVSLNEGVGEEGDSELIEFLFDENIPSVEKQIEEEFMKRDVEDVLKTITPREEKVLRLRFGFYNGIQKTLEEIGEEFGVTRERIRQIEAKALEKLRHPSRSNKLIPYIKE